MITLVNTQGEQAGSTGRRELSSVIPHTYLPSFHKPQYGSTMDKVICVGANAAPWST